MLLLNESSTEVHAFAMDYRVKCDILAIFATYESCQNRDSCWELVFSTSSAFTNFADFTANSPFLQKSRGPVVTIFAIYRKKSQLSQKSQKSRVLASSFELLGFVSFFRKIREF